MYLHHVLLRVGLLLLVLFNLATSLDPVAYLRRYGYLQQQGHGLLRDTSGSGRTRNAVLDFQRFVGLQQTGVLDVATLQKMEAPRCGNLDRKLQTSKRRRKRYRVTDGERWNKNVLSYKIFTYSNTMSQSSLESVIDNAFKYWSDVTNIRFYKSSASHPTQVDIPISFVTGDHGDLTPFDGRGGALAHAFYPRIGDIHFDDAEPWSRINLGSFGKYLLPVAVHEIGHSLGLNHSQVPDAVMAPYYKSYPLLSSFRLQQDDINAVQSLFGVKATGGGNTNPPTASTANVPKLTRGPPNYHPTRYYYPGTTYSAWNPSINAPNYGPTAGPGYNPPYMPTQGPGHNFHPTAGKTDQNWIGTRRNPVYVPTTYKPYSYVPPYVPTNRQQVYTRSPQVGGGRYTLRSSSTRSAIDTESFRHWLRRLG